jgi:glycosyltransferase involved in cell wall biosynthesis
MRGRTRSALGVSPETLVIGNVARLVPFKGHRILLEAIAGVIRHRTDVLVPVIGDGELLNDLESQARTLGIEHYIRFLGFRDNLNELYPAFDVYCHSSLELAAEAFPIAILRALASGLPVVATNVGGIRLMVDEGVSGYLTPPGNPAALGEALLRVLSRPELRASMGTASFSLFKRQFHASAMAQRVEEIYQQVLA